MATPRTLPPALEPYILSPSDKSLTVLTGTLGSTVSWLASRYIANALSATNVEDSTSSAVVLLSWLRDAIFWKNEIRRATGVDISRLAQSGKFAFVDCFSNAALTLEDAEKNVTSTFDRLSRPSEDGELKQITLVVDAPDVLLATTSTTATDLSSFLLSLRSHEAVQNTVLSVSADLPFLSAATPDANDYPHTPIEVETAAFVITQAHSARCVLSVRGLDTGAATDVSGVLRATRGGDYNFEASAVNDRELLYLLNRDGSVKVFERGSSGP